MSTMIQQDGPLQIVRPRAQRVLPSHLMTRGFDEKISCRSPDFVGRISSAEYEANQPNQQLIVPSESPFQAEKALTEPASLRMMEPASLRMMEPNLFKPTPRMIRPIALKVARPIPQSAVEQFYNEAYSQGIQAQEVHAATILAQDWHRKWTQQDEEGHTMPEPGPDSYQEALFRESRNMKGRTSQMLSSPEHCVYTAFDRMTGAKNPSPEELQDVQDDILFERKRLRFVNSQELSSLSPDLEDDMEQSSQSTDFEPPSSKRRVLGYQSSPMHTQPRAVSPEIFIPQGVVKPLALRVQRPESMDVATAINILTTRRNDMNHLIPTDVTRELCSQYNLSPLTIPSMSSIDRKKAHDKNESTELVGPAVPRMISHVSGVKLGMRLPEIEAARTCVLHRLAATGGDVVGDLEFMSNLDTLKAFYHSTGNDIRGDGGNSSEGTWLTLTKPTFFGNLGTNDDGDSMYTLGRMSFDMFPPTRLVCSLQGNFNSVQKVADGDRAEMHLVPKALLEEVIAGDSILRTYDIVTAFTIEPHMAAWPTAPNKDVRRPIKALMTTRGYILPDPENPNRQSVWITGGRIEPNDDPVDQREWNRQFAKNPPKHAFGEQAKLLAVKLLMGATIPTEMGEDGSMEYTFQRPLGGHGMAYVDTLYVDDSLRIVQGHRGTIFVFSKLPEKVT